MQLKGETLNFLMTNDSVEDSNVQQSGLVNNQKHSILKYT